ncbi:MAG: hypothetical protein WCK03_00830, partial [Candidatus Taylorbacteria bacterium]
MNNDQQQNKKPNSFTPSRPRFSPRGPINHGNTNYNNQNRNMNGTPVTRSYTTDTRTKVFTPKPDTSLNQNPTSNVSNSGAATPSSHRIVLGKGAHKHPEAVKHIAGARMNVIRKESRPMKRGGG